MRQYLWACLFFLSISAHTVFADNANPEGARANAQLGLAYLQKGLYPEAKDRILTAIKDDAHVPAGWYTMGYYLEKTGEPVAAETYYRKAISIAPHSGSAKNNYGTFLCRQKRYQEAIHEFFHAAETKNYLNVANAYENAGLCAMMIPDNAAARRYFQTAINHNPNMPVSLLNLARLEHIAGDEADAEKYFLLLKQTALHDRSPAEIARFKRYVFVNQ